MTTLKQIQKELCDSVYDCCKKDEMDCDACARKAVKIWLQQKHEGFKGHYPKNSEYWNIRNARIDELLEDLEKDKEESGESNHG